MQKIEINRLRDLIQNTLISNFYEIMHLIITLVSGFD